MSNVVGLRLPKPSDGFLLKIKNYIDSAKLNLDNKIWLDQFHQTGLNSALHLFDLVSSLNQDLSKEYQQYFSKHQLLCVVGIMKNIKNAPACQPPHTDRSRGLAINYYIELGGDDVRTLFYDKVSKIADRATNMHYSDLRVVEEHVFQTKWYAYNVTRSHSVENIQSTRYFMAIKFANVEDNYSLDDFKKDYPELIKAK